MTDMDEFERLLNSPDARNWDVLHPDLRRHVIEKPRIGKMIHHPLIVEIDPIIPLANKTYLARKAEFDKAKAARDLHRMLAWVQTPYRISSLIEWQADRIITAAQVVECMPGVWANSEPDDTDPTFLALWKMLASVATAGELVAELPDGDPLTVYRGQHGRREKRGIAWSLDPRIALKFAQRFNFHEFGAVLRGTVARADVLAYITNRGESEVIADPRRVRVNGIALVPVIGDTDADTLVYASHAGRIAR